MARPNKIGLDYFPLDVDFFEDEKMLAISGEFAVKGEVITLRLLCEIYRSGYFVEYSELLKNKLARLGGLSGGLVDEVVKKLVKYGFFDESLFSEHKILTSRGIQKRFAEAIKRRKNDLCMQYWLLSGVNADDNPQSKGEESKEEERKVKKRIPPTPSEGDSEEQKKFKNLQSWISKNTPTVAKLKTPFTLDEYVSIAAHCSHEQIMDVLEKMNNWLPLPKRHATAYGSFKVFAERNYGIKITKITSKK